MNDNLKDKVIKGSNIYSTLLDSAIKFKYPNLNPSEGFIRYSLSEILSLDEQEIEESITDGPNDWGIDAFYIDSSSDVIEVTLLSVKKKQTNLDNGFPKNDMELLIGRVEKFLDKGITNPKDIKENVKEKLLEITGHIKDGKFPIINIYFITNTITHFQEVSTESDYIKIHYKNAKDFSENKKEEIKHEITVINSMEEGNSVTANIYASELIALYEKCGKQKIISKNIRDYLGNNKINKEIEKSILNEDLARQFYHYNNGLSLACSYKKVKPLLGITKITLKNPQIINGGQTINTLYKNKNNKNIDKIKLLIRIFQTEDEDVIKKITICLNNQNKIIHRDLRSTDVTQIMLQKYLKNKNISLEIKRNEFKNNKEIKPKDIIKNDTLLKAYLSSVLELPHIAKNSTQNLFDYHFEKIMTDVKSGDLDIFLRLSEIILFLQEKTKGIKNYNYSFYAIIYIMYKLDNTLNENTYSKAIKIIDDIIHDEYKEDVFFSASGFFKIRYSTKVINKKLTKETPNDQ